MDLISKGQRTEVCMDSLESKIESTHDYIVIKNDLVPDYYGGNKIIFEHAPHSMHDLESCIEIYHKHFNVAAQKFIHFTWDQHTSDIPKSLIKDHGYHLFEGQTMQLETMDRPEYMNQGVDVHPVNWNKDIPGLQALHLDPTWERASIDFQNRYWTMKWPKLKMMEEVFPGRRWVVKKNKTIVADVGLYAFKNIARFHALMVDPEYRKQGLASRILFEAWDYAKKHWDVDVFVLVSEKNSDASKLYTNLGFKTIEPFYDVTKVF